MDFLVDSLMNQFALTLVCVIALQAHLADAREKSTTEPAEIHVVLLAGQSNMAGAGDFDSLQPEILKRLEAISKQVLVSLNGQAPVPLSSASRANKGSKYQFKRIFGPEMLVGLTLAESHPNQKYLFVKTTQGGTSLYGAWNPEWNAERSKAVERGEVKQALRLYDQYLVSIRENLKQLQEQRTPYKLLGMLWMQGENDAAREISAVQYKRNLQGLVVSIRRDVKTPKLPFVLGQINSTYGRFSAGPGLVRKAIADVAKEDPRVAMIATSTDRNWNDYPKHSDNVHYNTEGQVRLGRAFANALNKLYETPSLGETREKIAPVR